MGRGLSELQKFILSKAASQERVYYHEVLAEYFGFEYKPLKFSWYSDKRHYCQNFNLAVIGKKKYKAAQASLSRACLRLQQRGFVTRRAGIEITEPGKITVNTVKSFPNVNR